jgi:hypothetical protein
MLPTTIFIFVAGFLLQAAVVRSMLLRSDEKNITLPRINDTPNFVWLFLAIMSRNKRKTWAIKDIYLWDWIVMMKKDSRVRRYLSQGNMSKDMRNTNLNLSVEDRN